jgi:hypothetical protein
VLGAESIGVNTRTFEAIVDTITKFQGMKTPHITFLITIRPYFSHSAGIERIHSSLPVFLFRAPDSAIWGQAVMAVRAMQWTLVVGGFPPVCTAWIVSPKSTSSLTEGVISFP